MSNEIKIEEVNNMILLTLFVILLAVIAVVLSCILVVALPVIGIVLACMLDIIIFAGVIRLFRRKKE